MFDHQSQGDQCSQYHVQEHLCPGRVCWGIPGCTGGHSGRATLSVLPPAGAQRGPDPQETPWTAEGQ